MTNKTVMEDMESREINVNSHMMGNVLLSQHGCGRVFACVRACVHTGHM